MQSPEYRQYLHECKRRYQFRLPIGKENRCASCWNHRRGGNTHRCELLDIVIADHRKSNCPAYNKN